MRTIPETRQMLEEAVKEIAAVAKARKINLKDDAVDRDHGSDRRTAAPDHSFDAAGHHGRAAF